MNRVVLGSRRHVVREHHHAGRLSQAGFQPVAQASPSGLHRLRGPPSRPSRRRRSRRCPTTFSVPARRPAPGRRRAAAAPAVTPSARINAPTPLGPPILCAETVNKIRPQCIDIERYFSERLDRVDMQQPAGRMDDARPLPRPAESPRSRCWPASPRPAPAARLPARPQPRRDRARRTGHRDGTIASAETARPPAPRRARSPRPAAARPGPGRAEPGRQRQRVGLGSAGREDHIPRGEPPRRRAIARPRVLDQPAGLTAFRMHRRRIAADVPRRRHRLPRLGAQRRGRIPVEIDPVGHRRIMIPCRLRNDARAACGRIGAVSAIGDDDVSLQSRSLTP